MVFFGNYSHLGSEHSINHGDADNWEDLKKLVEEEYEIGAISNVYAYSHSGLTVSTTPFPCPWDSGQLGFALVSKEDIRKRYGIKRVTKKYQQLALDVIDDSVVDLDNEINYCEEEECYE
jgi:hypothetical protein